MELEKTLQEKESESELLLRVAGSQSEKWTDLTLKMYAFLKTTERSDFLNTIWNKDSAFWEATIRHNSHY